MTPITTREGHPIMNRLRKKRRPHEAGVGPEMLSLAGLTCYVTYYSQSKIAKC